MKPQRNFARRKPAIPLVERPICRRDRKKQRKGWDKITFPVENQIPLFTLSSRTSRSECNGALCKYLRHDMFETTVQSCDREDRKKRTVTWPTFEVESPDAHYSYLQSRRIIIKSLLRSGIIQSDLPKLIFFRIQASEIRELSNCVKFVSNVLHSEIRDGCSFFFLFFVMHPIFFYFSSLCFLGNDNNDQRLSSLSTHSRNFEWLLSFEFSR